MAQAGSVAAKNGMLRVLRAARLVTAGLTLGAVAPLEASDIPIDQSRTGNRFSLDLETGGVWFSRNDVRIPGDTGTEFDMLDLTGTGPDTFFRVNFTWDVNPHHGLRFVAAPLEVRGRGELSQTTDFAGETFEPGPAEGSYQFNTYKLTYRYTFYNRKVWRWRVGFTGLIRDANVELKQGDKRANDDNVGFAPLLRLYGEYRFAPRWLLTIDFDGLASPQGRAFDLAFLASYDLARHWSLGGGYRTLEGGADNDDVYNFAWLHYAVFSAGYRF